jgi:hypothetical protein
MTLAGAEPVGETPAMHPIVARLERRIAGEVVLQEVLYRDVVLVDEAPVLPTGVDAAACVLARQVALDDHLHAVAMAFPRGLGSHPAMLGLHLALLRHLAAYRFSGSVSVATRQGELVKRIGGLHFMDARFAKLRAGRLVRETVPGSGGTDINGQPKEPRKRAAFRPASGGKRLLLSEADGYLLFHPPRPLPPMPVNVVWAQVVDTIGAGRPWRGKSDPDYPDMWTQTWDANAAAGRRQVWLGELGDRDFEVFCADRNVPLVRFDWPLIGALSGDGFDSGCSYLAARALRARARTSPAAAPVKYHVVQDPDRDELVDELHELLRKMRRRGRDERGPVALRTAYELCSRVCRMAAPSRYYEAQYARRLGARTVGQMMDELRATHRSAFVGRHWKDAHDVYWSGVVSACRRLAELAASEHCAKYEALFDRVAEAQACGERLRVLCQNETERLALRAALADLDLEVPVVGFSRRLPFGPTNGADVTLCLGAPAPWQAHLLLTGEAGRLEVLCYRHEVPRLRRLARAAADPAAVDAANHAALDALDIPRVGPVSAPPEEAAPVTLVPGYEYTPQGDSRVAEPVTDKPAPDTGPGLWQELITMWGEDLPGRSGDEDEDEDGDEGSFAYGGYARELRFDDGSRVLFRDDGELDVLTVNDDGEEVIVGLTPGQLERGMTVAFLPGSGRRSLLDILMAAYDDRLAAERRLFEPLYRRALDAAVATHGVAELARIVGRERFSVWDWLADRAKPGDERAFELLLVASGDQEAYAARAPMWEYLSHKRGVHRRIGWLMRQAIAETLLGEPDRPQLRALETLVARTDLEDLFDQVEELKVLRVGEPELVPLRYCGRYLDSDDPMMAAFLRQRGNP